jgi:hypothetical protein
MCGSWFLQEATGMLPMGKQRVRVLEERKETSKIIEAQDPKTSQQLYFWYKLKKKTQLWSKRFSANRNPESTEAANGPQAWPRLK